MLATDDFPIRAPFELVCVEWVEDINGARDSDSDIALKHKDTLDDKSKLEGLVGYRSFACC